MSYFANNSTPLYSYTPQRTTGLSHLQQQQNNGNNGTLQSNAQSNQSDPNPLTSSTSQRQPSQQQASPTVAQQQQQQQQQSQQTIPQPTQPQQPLVQGPLQAPVQQLQPPPPPPSQVQQSAQSSNADINSNQVPTSDSNSPSSKAIRINRPGQRFGAKKKSWVWSWFVQDSQDPNIAACDYCGKIILRLPSDKGSPKKLSEHLKVHKVNKETINYTRSVPVDGYGVTYNNNGEPIEYPANYNEQQDAISVSAQGINIGGSARVIPVSAVTPKPRAPRFNPGDYTNLSSRRFISNDFDNTTYTSMKFHKHLMKFLTENKLPISVIKSHSFQQLVYDLRSDSVNDLIDLTGLYNTLLEVSRLSEAGSGHDITQESDTSIVDRSTN